MIRTLLALFGLLLALAGIGMFVAIGTYVWSVKAEANRQTTLLTVQANTAGDAADRAIGFVREVIDKAQGELEDTRILAARAAPGRPVNPFVQITARKASQDLAGSVERAHGAVVVASDATVVAEAALKVFDDNEELKNLFSVRADQVDATKSALGNVSVELRQAKTVLGVPIAAPGELPTPEQLNAVDDALGQARGFTDEMKRVVATARSRVNDAKSAAERWAKWIALATTLACGIAIIGQVALVRFCWRTLRCLPA